MADKATHTFDLKDVPPEYRDELEALIPDPAFADKYINRTFAGGIEDFALFDAAFGSRHNVMMAGPTGAGKTMAGRAYAAARRLPFASVEYNGGMDPQTAIGVTTVNPDNGLPFYKYGEMSLVTMFGGVQFHDEVNNMSGRMTAAYHGLLDARQSLYISELGKRINKSPNCIVFAAYNPRYHGTSMLNQAFLNKFAYTIDPWGYDARVEDELIGAYSPTLLNRVRAFRQEKKIHADIGTNVMEEFIDHASVLNLETAIQLFLDRMPTEDRMIMTPVFEAEAHAIGDELGVT